MWDGEIWRIFRVDVLVISSLRGDTVLCIFSCHMTCCLNIIEANTTLLTISKHASRLVETVTEVRLEDGIDAILSILKRRPFRAIVKDLILDFYMRIDP